jgi:hypothetical protein
LARQLEYWIALVATAAVELSLGEQCADLRFRCRRRAAIKRADKRRAFQKFNPALGEQVEQLQYWIVMHETKAMA